MAASALPALGHAPTANPYMGNGHATHTNGAVSGGNGHAKPHPANAHMAIPIAMHVPESQPILPPRPTGRMEASGTSSPSTWKSWPVVVIGLAVIAIVVAVIIMVWPPSDPPHADAKTLAPPPAPERMDTNPSPSTPGPSSQADPWSNKGGAAPDPAPSQPSPPTVPDPIPSDPDDPSLADPFRNRNGGGGINSNAMVGMAGAIKKHACDRLKACPNPDDMLTSICDLSSLAMPKTPAPTCSAAQRCLSTIDAMPCDDIDESAVMGVFQGAQACIEAMSC